MAKRTDAAPEEKDERKPDEKPDELDQGDEADEADELDQGDEADDQGDEPEPKPKPAPKPKPKPTRKPPRIVREDYGEDVRELHDRVTRIEKRTRKPADDTDTGGAFPTWAKWIVGILVGVFALPFLAGLLFGRDEADDQGGEPQQTKGGETDGSDGGIRFGG